MAIIDADPNAVIAPIVVVRKERRALDHVKYRAIHAVILGIILRDFWDTILRPLVTHYRRSNANARA
jgi:hypothetical protein